jgi:transposase
LRALRGVTIDRKNWLFAGSKAVGKHAAIIYSVIKTAKLNGIEPQAYIIDIIASNWPASPWRDLMPRNWQSV